MIFNGNINENKFNFNLKKSDILCSIRINKIISVVND